LRYLDDTKTLGQNIMYASLPKVLPAI